MAYGPDETEVIDRIAALGDRILHGAKPADLPLELPTRFRFSVNLKRAQALGLTIPDAILARADEVIE
jgi:putative tryptophan/tyrosine transport system substrate-binding protein